MGFLVIPALDLKDRKCVQLRGGDPEKKLVELDDPLEIAKRWERLGAERLHLIDLDGAIEENRVNEDIVIKIIEKLRIPVQYGGGMRYFEDASKFLNLGVEKVILGTIAIKKPEVLRNLEEMYGRERIIVALDSREGYVVIKGWKERTGVKAEELAENFKEFAYEFLFTNVDVEGRLGGIDEEIIKKVVKATDGAVIVSGGVSTIEDIRKVKTLGAKGVVIGSALYTGKIDFKETLKL
ncbi:MAG TPA: 1-(5-phosphoribosyl)-5-[(5-phosphoribosylamino)methylideneamino]imidazole-4-carboxamide isomerase [Euryarchaeota archaeon]|nr:1-(5-phosphoribosyl)-5-[(5-phosphoribosylamino)methylideneamino]imidazole-4-carboxamide isomerase [Euryarchaeota archaeon]